MPYNINAYRTRSERERSFTWAKIPISYMDSIELGNCSAASKCYYVWLTLFAVSIDGDGHIFHADGLLDKTVKEIAWRLRTNESILNEAFDELSSVGLMERIGDYCRLTRYMDEQIDQREAKKDQDHERALHAARQAKYRDKLSSDEKNQSELEVEKEVEVEVEGDASRDASQIEAFPPPAFSNEYSQAVYSFCEKIGWGETKSREAAEKRVTASQYADFIALLSKKGNPVAQEELERIDAKKYETKSQSAIVDTALTRRMENFTPRKPVENSQRQQTT